MAFGSVIYLYYARPFIHGVFGSLGFRSVPESPMLPKV